MLRKTCENQVAEFRGTFVCRKKGDCTYAVKDKMEWICMKPWSDSILKSPELPSALKREMEKSNRFEG